MFHALSPFRRAQSKTQVFRPQEGERIYAVGDVHGRADLLENLLEAIEGDAAEARCASVKVVFLGDLIDRGPDSRRVIERLSQPLGFATGVFLMGNHEEIALRALDGERGVIPRWMRFGGAEFLTSYGLDASELAVLGEQDILTALRQRVPPAHIEFLRSFEDVHRSGDYLFVHAGIRPGVPLAEQKTRDLRWIRDDFLNDGRMHEDMVVHGHSISAGIDAKPNRIGIDTGAYRTGVLSALVIDGDRCSVVQSDEKLGVVCAEC